jgi:hypothetical protein
VIALPQFVSGASADAPTPPPTPKQSAGRGEGQGKLVTKLPDPNTRKLYLDVYEFYAKAGRKPSWSKFRQRLFQVTEVEPLSRPILAEQIYSMWRDPETRAEIERRGLADVIHKPPGE